MGTPGEEPLPETLEAARQEVRRLRDENERLREVIAEDLGMPWKNCPEVVQAVAWELAKGGAKSPATIVGVMQGALRKRMRLEVSRG